MKILVLSFYYRPDLSAGSFRATPLVEALVRNMPVGSTIEVVTTLPNRYRSFEVRAEEREVEGMVTITRIALPPHRSGMLDQSKAFIAFARGARRAVKGRDYDLVFATSSRLLTAALGAWIARSKGARLFLDIRDIFVDTINDVMSKRLLLVAKPVFERLERWTIEQADKVNLVSEGFGPYFSSRYPGQSFSFFTNGIDDEFILSDSSPVVSSTDHDPRMVAVYAGNIGEGQGLHAILPRLARRMADRVRFQIIGDGGRLQELRRALLAADVTNVELLPPMSRPSLIAHYQRADLLFLHLNDYDAFRRVLPSKIFEYAALGKPVWAGVGGYAARFIEHEVTNAAVFHPCDAGDAAAAFERLSMADHPRPEFVEKYSRAGISARMSREILEVGNAAR